MWAAVSALLLAPTARRKDNADLPPASATAYLRVETVPLQAAGQGLDLPGRAGADAGHLVHVYAPLSGRLMNLSLTPRQKVRNGQTIAMLHSGDVAQAHRQK